MPDITMCRDKECSDKGACYRFTAPPSRCRQAYFSGVVRITEGPMKGSCPHFIPFTDTLSEISYEESVADSESRVNQWPQWKRDAAARARVTPDKDDE